MENRLRDLLTYGLLGQGLPTQNRLSGLLEMGQTPSGAVTANQNMLSQGLRGMQGKTQVGLPTMQGLLDFGALATAPVPVLGDLLGLGSDAYRFATDPSSRTPMNYGLSAVGLLPFVPAAGIVNFKKGYFKGGYSDKLSIPDNVKDSLKMTPSGKSALLNDNLNVTLRQTPEGNYISEYVPHWGTSEKPFYGTGDNLSELIDSTVSRIKNSARGVKAAKTASLEGRLINEFGEGTFKVKKSERSNSQYLIHEPSGMKIRISDHELPLGYVQPDLNLPATMTDAEKFEAIRKFLRD